MVTMSYTFLFISAFIIRIFIHFQNVILYLFTLKLYRNSPFDSLVFVHLLYVTIYYLSYNFSISFRTPISIIIFPLYQILFNTLYSYLECLMFHWPLSIVIVFCLFICFWHVIVVNLNIPHFTLNWFMNINEYRLNCLVSICVGLNTLLVIKLLSWCSYLLLVSFKVYNLENAVS